MEFNQGSELLEICSEKNIPISRVMKLREQSFPGFLRRKWMRK